MTSEVVPIADTSLFIAVETDRPLRTEPPPSFRLSVITVGELRAGVLAAASPEARARRLRSLTKALETEPLPVDDAVAAAWAEMRHAMRSTNSRLPTNDSWIAATALAHELPVVTQDDDFDAVPGLRIIKL